MTVYSQSLTVKDCFRKIVENVVLAYFYSVQDSPAVAGGLCGEEILVVFVARLRENDRETMNRLAGHGRQDTCNGTGVKSAAEMAAYRHIALKPQLNSLLQAGAIFIHILLLPSWCELLLIAAGRIVHVPISDVLPPATGLPYKQMARLQLPYALEKGTVCWLVLYRQCLHQTVFIPFGLYTTGVDGFCFRCYNHSSAIIPPTQGFDAEAVTSCYQQALPFVIQNEGKLASQVFHHTLEPILQIEGYQQLAVGIGLEGIVGRKRLSQSFIVVKLSIDHNDHPSIRRTDGLVSVPHTDNGQSPVAQGYVLVLPHAAVIRTA